MKKISQGKFEVSTTKADAINKFMQLEGYCREELTYNRCLSFYCSKKGKIYISNVNSGSNKYTCDSTHLIANVVEQDGKTYVTYLTRFSSIINVIGIVFIAVYIVLYIVGIVMAVDSNIELYNILGLVAILSILIYNLFVSSNEKAKSKQDSDILIKALESKIEAVNRWDE